MEDNEIWLKHYSSNQRILLVGEGDFSFSTTLASHFGSASNIVATSLDSYDILVAKYKKAKVNLEILSMYGACTLHGVDATKMRLHTDLMMQRFDRIIFNFPHAGFDGREDNTRLIEKHKKLVLDFFRNASGMLRANGEIHITHKTSFPFSSWNIPELARRNSLGLIDCVDFKIEDYPGYNNKRGDCRMRRCDQPFPLGKCSTFKFRFFPAIKNMSRLDNNTRIRSERSNGYLSETDYQPTPFHHRHPETHLHVGNADHLNRTSENFQTPNGSDLRGSAYGTQTSDYERSIAEAVRRCHQYQTNPSKDQYQGDPLELADVQRGFTIDTNKYCGYNGTPLPISIGRENLKVSDRYSGEAWMHIASIYGQYSGGAEMSEYARSVESSLRRLHERNVLYQNAEKASGFQHYR
ncbi:hypothetical protein M5689_013974 [Euphorbia peplus]|nr:hypothetical protein M5689_013974 [Euphorbia peplus]